MIQRAPWLPTTPQLPPNQTVSSGQVSIKHQVGSVGGWPPSVQDQRDQTKHPDPEVQKLAEEIGRRLRAENPDHADIKDQVEPETLEARYWERRKELCGGIVAYSTADSVMAVPSYDEIAGKVIQLSSPDRQKLYEFLHNALGCRMPR